MRALMLSFWTILALRGFSEDTPFKDPWQAEIPKIQFIDTSIKECVDRLNELLKQNNQTYKAPQIHIDPNLKTKIHLQASVDQQNRHSVLERVDTLLKDCFSITDQRLVNLRLAHLPVEEVLNIAAEIGGMYVSIDGNDRILSPNIPLVHVELLDIPSKEISQLLWALGLEKNQQGEFIKDPDKMLLHAIKSPRIRFAERYEDSLLLIGTPEFMKSIQSSFLRFNVTATKDPWKTILQEFNLDRVSLPEAVAALNDVIAAHCLTEESPTVRIDMEAESKFIFKPHPNHVSDAILRKTAEALAHDFTFGHGHPALEDRRAVTMSLRKVTAGEAAQTLTEISRMYATTEGFECVISPYRLKTYGSTHIFPPQFLKGLAPEAEPGADVTRLFQNHTKFYEGKVILYSANTFLVVGTKGLNDGVRSVMDKVNEATK